MKKYLVTTKFQVEAENEDEVEQIIADMVSEIEYNGNNYQFEHFVKELREAWITILKNLLIMFFMVMIK